MIQDVVIMKAGKKKKHAKQGTALDSVNRGQQEHNHVMVSKALESLDFARRRDHRRDLYYAEDCPDSSYNRL